MKIREELIGSIVNFKSKNGVKQTFILKQSEAELYHNLGLDVFEKHTQSKPVVTEIKATKSKGKNAATKK
jgi:N-acetylglutamate synthase-like GNAT family acetyltransferase